jgi:hypothetical protein
VVTNLHALDWSVIHGDDFHVLVLGARGQRLRARVLALDAAQDLVVLQTGLPLVDQPMTLSEELPREGAELFAFGQPGGEGFLVEAGTSEGLEDAYLERNLWFRGRIRPGMSGGPVVDRSGRVVGVNRARNNDDHDLGYVIPAAEVRRLLDKARIQPYADAQAMLEDLGSQYRVFAALHVDQWTSNSQPIARLGPFGVPGWYGECTPARFDTPSDRFQVYRLTCYSQERVNYLGDEDLAEVGMRHYWIKNPGQSTEQAARAATYLMEYLRDTEIPETREHGHWQCRYQRVRNAAGLSLDLQACRRPYLRLSGIHDYRLRAALAVTWSDALVTVLGITGMDDANARRLTQHWLDRVQVRGQVVGSGRLQ